MPRIQRLRPCTPDLFSLARERELLADHQVRRIALRLGVSPELAAAIVELAQPREARR